MLMPPLVRKVEPGDVVGRCRAVRELGRGGVGTVYLATHQALQIEVALKILSPALSLENPALAERFIRESQLAARIRHPNVVAVMDAGHDEASGLYYIIMEYVGGGSLSWHLKKGPMTEARALSIITGIAHALVIAEENRIVHRDIKPENIMLDLRGTAKLADLGLAKHALDSNASLTIGGSFMGTPAYMSPEQARDAKIADTRDDIYSLGASFYECLTGEPPFQGETPYNIMHELLTKPSPRPCALRPGLSRSADLICRKMMAKTRDLRYADARALLADLQHAQVYGDSGLDGLDAASLDTDAVAAHRRETVYGVQTSSEGVYAEPENEPPVVPIARGGPLVPPRRAGNDVFSAAALLIVFVLVVTLFAAWAGPSRQLAMLGSRIAALTGEPSTPAPPIVVTPSAKKKKEHVKERPAADQTPVVAVVTPPAVTVPAETNQAPVVTPVAPPVALPESQGTNASPVNPPLPPMVPVAVIGDGAFTARDTAEKSLDESLVAPTGHAELLRVVGDRGPGQTTPPIWKYYFFDKGAAGNARIVSVQDGRVVKSGEDIADVVAPYQSPHILAEEKLLIDSPQALQIAQALVPTVAVSSADYLLLLQKNGGPVWKVTLWTRNAKGDEHRLGDVTLQADTGKIVQGNLKLQVSAQ